MEKDVLMRLLCSLTTNYYDFESEQRSLVYEFSGKKYEVNFTRINGEFMSFSIEYKKVLQ